VLLAALLVSTASTGADNAAFVCCCLPCFIKAVSAGADQASAELP
jgi:hypothetical protein